MLSKLFPEYKQRKQPLDSNHEHFLNEELDIIQQMTDGVQYYKHILDNIDLHPDNTTNSHVMWCFGKVDKIDPNKSVQYKPGHVSLPDIDVDVTSFFRPQLIEYTRSKYGRDCVANIATFSRMDGKGAIKEIFRILNPTHNSFEMANLITSHMIDSQQISDELEDLKEDNPKYNSIHYNIDYVDIIKNDYYPEYKREFDIAIKIASTIKSIGKHAGGIVISNSPICENFPVRIDNETIVLALEMECAEYAGAVKYDFLGVLAYDKIGAICGMINDNLLEPEINEYSELEDDIFA